MNKKGHAMGKEGEKKKGSLGPRIFYFEWGLLDAKEGSTILPHAPRRRTCNLPR